VLACSGALTALLWRFGFQVRETQEALDISKLHTLGAFMEQVLVADPEV
jgi:hypothetical protein